MFDRPLDRLEAVARRALPWLVLIAGYFLSLVAIWSMWDPPPQGGELPPWYGFALLLWVVGYPTSLWVIWERAKTDGAQAEQERRERFDQP